MPIVDSFTGLNKKQALEKLRTMPTAELEKLLNECGGTAKGVAVSTGASERRVQELYKLRHPDPMAEGIKEQFYLTRCKRLEKENEKLANWRELIAETLVTSGAVWEPTTPPKKIESGNRDEHLCILNISDVHVGEFVSEADTGGLTTYSFEEFVTRCERYKEHLRVVIQDMRAAYPIRNVMINFLGDIATSEGVFPLQLARNDLHLNDQIAKAAWYMADIVKFACELFENVYVFCVAGNHKPKTITFDSDSMIYAIMGTLLKDQPNLEFRVSESSYCGVRIGPEEPYLDFGEWEEPTHVLLAHGHQTAWFNGVPYYGFDRMMMRFTQMTRTSWDIGFVGHGHTPAMAGLWHMNGAWPGGTEYTVGRLQAASWPSQAIMFFHPKYGIRLVDKIYLTERPKLMLPDNLGVLTPTNGGIV